MTIIRAWHGDGSPTGVIAGGNIATMIGTGDNAFTGLTGSPELVASGDLPNRLACISAGASPTSTPTKQVRWGSIPATSAFAFSFMYAIAAVPDGGVSPTVCTWYNAGLVAQGRLDYQASQQRLRIRNASAVVTNGTALSVPPGTLVRVSVVVTGGTVTVKVYAGRTATVLDTIVGAVASTVTDIGFGTDFAVTGYKDTFYDDMMFNNVAVEIPAWGVANTGSGSTTRVGTASGHRPTYTVAEWLAEFDHPAVAHRGAPSGHTRSECSPDTYDNAAAVGFRAFEAPFHRSSDGVWVLNHDLDTGDQYTTDIVIATSTLATLRALTRRYGVTTEPMMTMAEFFAAYPDVVVLAENKTYTNDAEFLDLLEDADPTHSRIVFKAFFNATSAMTAAKARGFITWAYFFGDADASQLPTYWGPHMDWVGLSSGPSNDLTSQVWFDWCATRSIPIIGHVMEVEADWTSARAQGADMGMVNAAELFPLDDIPNAGTAAGSTTRVGSAVGARTSSGSSTGATTWSGTASGSMSAKGVGAGLTVWTGTASGASTHSGAAVGVTVRQGAASGAVVRSGVAAGVTAWTGTARGGELVLPVITGPMSLRDLTPPRVLIDMTGRRTMEEV